MKTSRIEDILMEACEPDTGLITIGKHDHDALRELLAQAHQAGIDEAVGIVKTFKSEIPKTTRKPFELAENVGKQMVLDEVIKALQDNK